MCWLQVVHRDVKSANVLLSEDFQSAKVCDVGLARIMGGSTLSSSSHNVHATFAYAAPEIILCERLVLLLLLPMLYILSLTASTT